MKLKNMHIQCFRYILIFALAIGCVISALSSELQFYDAASGSKSRPTFMPYVALQAWATYNMNEQNEYKEYADRSDMSFRRFRFGGSGTANSWLSYDFQLHFDRLGEDEFAATKGSYDGIGVWNAYVSARLLPQSNLLNLHLGYFWSAISREYNTSPWAVSSFDKTRATWYLRNFVTGKGNGIESGIGLGGLKNFESCGVSYRVGIYEPDAYNSSQFADRLYTARLMFSIGDPEQSSYKYMLSGNQWGNKKGVTIGFGGSSQLNGQLSDSTYFDRSVSYGADILINYQALRIDADYFILKRSAHGIADYDGTTWHLRIAYCVLFRNHYVEPVITYDSYEGSGSKSLFKHVGKDTTLDFGINWYLNKEKLKLSLHYLIQNGSASSNVGDYVGLAFQVKI